MKVGYIRVSTLEQNTARQEVLMDELKVEKIYTEKVSGKNTDRPELKKMIEFVREGDCVVVESISRFARNTKDLLELVEILNKKNVEFFSKKEAIDTTTPQGKFMLTIFGALSQLERDNILERQAEGIAIAKAEGKYKGRKPIPVDQSLFTELYRQWKNGETQPKYMIKRLGINRATFYRRVKEYELKHGIVTENEQ